MTKRLLKLLVGLVVLVIIAVVIAIFTVDGFAKRAVERQATAALGVDASLGNLHVAWMSRSGTIGDLKIDNAAGYSDARFLVMDDGSAAVTLASLLSETVEVPTVELTGMVVYLEKRGGKANYEAIMENLREFQKTPPGQEPAKRGKKFIIRTLTIRNTVVHVKSDLPPISQSVTIPLIQLQDVGSDSDHGVVLGEVTDIVIQAVLTKFVEQAGLLLPGLAGELARLEKYAGAGVKILDEAGKQIEGLGAAAEELGETIEGGRRAVEDLRRGVGDILGGERRREDESGNE